MSIQIILIEYNKFLAINALATPQYVFDLLGQGAGTSDDLARANDYETVYSKAVFIVVFRV